MTAENNSPFATDLQTTVFYNTYARWNPALGRRETWPETVDRVCTWMQRHIETEFLQHGLPPAVPWQELKQGMLTLQALPSMRLVQMAGPALDRCHVASYNCAYLPLQDWRALSELLYILMQGTGCGFSVEQIYVDRFTDIKPQDSSLPVGVHRIQDTTEGWCDALHEGLVTWANGGDVEFDYSAIRPYGAPLATKGGRASGPEPLRQLLDYARTMLLRHQGRKLSSLNLHDLACYCGSIVQVGGVRRSAEISLSDLHDSRMATAKQGQFWLKAPERSMANNSAVYTAKPDLRTFTNEWLTMIENETGERGLFNRGDINKWLPKRRERRDDWGVNPCVTGDTIIMTVDGPKSFKELADAGNDVQVHAWHPETKTPVIRWMRRPHMTQKNAKLMSITFDSGLVVRCTKNHNFYSFRGNKVQAQHLKVGQSIRAWSMSQHRDGQLRVHGWNSDENCANHQWVHRMTYEAAYGAIPEGMVIHHIDGDPLNNTLSNLTVVDPIEHNSIHYPERFANGFDGKARNHKVTAVEELVWSEDVYNGCVDDAHSYVIVDPKPIAGIQSGIVSANCGEIILRPFQFCNLSIAVARPDDDLSVLTNKVRLAAIWGTLQSTLTRFAYIRPEWQQNCEQERLLGVDITGQMDNQFIRSEVHRANVYNALRSTARATNETYADLLGIPRSAAVTCVKPSGNSSQLLNVSSGIHPRYAPYYIRRIRIGTSSPLCGFLKAAGVPGSPEVGQVADTATVWVFEFPVKSPNGALCRQAAPASIQLQQWLACKQFYTEHNPSCTIYVKPEEWLEVASWVYNHWDMIGGLSFLPYDGGVYQLAPYEAIEQSDYEKRLNKWPQLEWAKLAEFETQDTTEVNREYSCTGEKCEW